MPEEVCNVREHIQQRVTIHGVQVSQSLSLSQPLLVTVTKWRRDVYPPPYFHRASHAVSCINAHGACLQRRHSQRQPETETDNDEDGDEAKKEAKKAAKKAAKRAAKKAAKRAAEKAADKVAEKDNVAEHNRLSAAAPSQTHENNVSIMSSRNPINTDEATMAFYYLKLKGIPVCDGDDMFEHLARAKRMMAADALAREKEKEKEVEEKEEEAAGLELWEQQRERRSSSGVCRRRSSSSSSGSGSSSR